MKKKKSLFITFEGCEGSGKTTHSKLIVKLLKEKGYSVVHTREPGGTRFAESVRKVLLDPKNRITSIAELLLYEASRAQHVAEIILPALKQSKIIICDRYTDATLAYQGYARGLSTKLIENLNEIATQKTHPDLTIIFDIPVEEGLLRARSVKTGALKNAGDRLEQESVEFHRKVRQGYLRLAKKERSRIKVVTNKNDINETHRDVKRIIKKIIKI